jgi:hypothetical protein
MQVRDLKSQAAPLTAPPLMAKAASPAVAVFKHGAESAAVKLARRVTVA